MLEEERKKNTQETLVFVCLTQQKKKGPRTQTESVEVRDYVLMFRVRVNEALTKPSPAIKALPPVHAAS